MGRLFREYRKKVKAQRAVQLKQQKEEDAKNGRRRIRFKRKDALRDKTVSINQARKLKEKLR